VALYVKHISFGAGLLWGIIFFSLHLYAVIDLIVTQGYGVGRFLLPIFLICYAALHSGLWFFCAQKTGALFGNKKSAVIVGWVFWSFLFFTWAPHGLLWISGKHIGYPFMLPLLPLAQYPQLLFALSSLGRNVLLVCMICFAMATALFCVQHKKRYFLIACVFLLPFIAGFWIHKKEHTISVFLATSGYVKPPPEQLFCRPLDCAQEIYYRLRRLLKENKNIRYVFMPELSFRFALNKHLYVIDLWNNALKNSVQLIIGACYQEGEKTYNALYQIQNGKIQAVYHKHTLMPLVEYLPSWCRCIPVLHTLFLRNRTPFCCGSKKSKVLQCAHNVNFIPYICADIFFEGKRRGGMSDNTHFLSIINDSIFSKPYYNNLFLLWNTFKVLELNKALLYVGFSRALFIDCAGKTENILTKIN